MGSGCDRERVCLDRISSLPGKAINKILVNLPIREAVATSKLSRIWRHRWMSILELVFDEHSALRGQTSDQRVNFINNVLLLHDGNITRFEIKHFLNSASPNLDRWLLLLSRKKLINLFIQFPCTSSYVCSSNLFYCQALTSLVLAGCGLQVPPQGQFKGFHNLTVLGLVNVTANKETIESLVNTSPLLQILVIKDCNATVSRLNIKAPNLISCTIKGKCKDITFGNTPKLMFMDINACVNRKIARCKLDEILYTIVHLYLQEARISHPFIEGLSFDNLWGMCVLTCYLKHVRLEIDFEDSKQILAAFWLFINTRSLKTVFIFSVHGVNKDVFNGQLSLKEFCETQDVEEYTLESIEAFEFGGFEGSENELNFIQFILWNATELETMTIKWKRDAPTGLKKESALVKLLQFQRTSSRVKINISG